MRIDRRFFVAGCASAVLVANEARAGVAFLSDDDILNILSERIDVQKKSVGMAVGTIERTTRRIVSYGRLGVTDDRFVTAETVFEIGSITKVFTALLLADMAHKRELRLDDPVARYLPQAFKIPERNGRAITLADLATHTSGLPLFPPLQGPPLTAIANYRLEDFRSWLAELDLTFEPGSQWAYSNAGYGLLGIALAHRGGVEYAELLRRRILTPLRLSSTALRPLGSMTERLAHGHDPSLKPVAALDLGIFAAAGALRSTVQDLLTFIHALMPDSSSAVAAASRLLLSIRRPAPQIGATQALGWEMISGPGRPFISKDGVTAGQGASAVVDLVARRGVVVLSNTLPVIRKPPPDGGIGAEDLARHLLRPEIPLGMN